MTTLARRGLNDERLEELRSMVHDDRYMAAAILRLACALSDQIMDGHGVLDGGWKQGTKTTIR